MTKEESKLRGALRFETFERAEKTKFAIGGDLQDELYFEEDGKVVNWMLKEYGNDTLDEDDLRSMAKLYVGLQKIYLEVKKDYEAGNFKPDLSKF